MGYKIRIIISKPHQLPVLLQLPRGWAMVRALLAGGGCRALVNQGSVWVWIGLKAKQAKFLGQLMKTSSWGHYSLVFSLWFAVVIGLSVGRGFKPKHFLISFFNLEKSIFHFWSTPARDWFGFRFWFTSSFLFLPVAPYYLTEKEGSKKTNGKIC